MACTSVCIHFDPNQPFCSKLCRASCRFGKHLSASSQCSPTFPHTFPHILPSLALLAASSLPTACPQPGRGFSTNAHSEREAASTDPVCHIIQPRWQKQPCSVLPPALLPFGDREGTAQAEGALPQTAAEPKLFCASVFPPVKRGTCQGPSSGHGQEGS